MKLTIYVSCLITFSVLLVACVPAAPGPNMDTPTLPPIPEVLPTPSSILPFDTQLMATINIAEHPLATPGMIGNHPDEVVYAGGFIWAKTANGHLIQVDPATNTMIKAIKVDTTAELEHYCQGLGTDGEDVWVCSASGEDDTRTIDIVHMDTQAQEIVSTIKVGKLFDQFDMPFVANQIWVLTGNGDKLTGIDVRTDQPAPAIDLGTRCFQLAATDRALFAACTIDNLILQIDPDRREVTRRVSIKNPRMIAAAENGIWVVQENAVLRLGPESLYPVVAFTNLPRIGSMGDIFATDDAVWLRQETGFLYRINPANNQFIEQIKPNGQLTGGSVLATTDSIWTTAMDDNVLFRLSLND